MSVTKWIHYHHGDSGVRNLFRKVQRALKPGGECSEHVWSLRVAKLLFYSRCWRHVAGLFLLEPQPWRSYKKKQRLTPGKCLGVIAALRPNHVCNERGVDRALKPFMLTRSHPPNGVKYSRATEFVS